jgi:hypothetical protein
MTSRSVFRLFSQLRRGSPSRSTPKNLAASIRERLRQRATADGRPFDEVTYYANEVTAVRTPCLRERLPELTTTAEVVSKIATPTHSDRFEYVRVAEGLPSQTEGQYIFAPIP